MSAPSTPDLAGIPDRVTELERRTDRLEEGQRDDDRARGVLASVDSGLAALSNGFADLSRTVRALDAHRAQQQALPAGILTNMLSQSFTGQEAGSWQAMLPTLLALVLFYFGPKLTQAKKALPTKKAEGEASPLNGSGPDDQH